MRAAEYVRSDIIVSATPKPRVYAVLAGVMAYAERNSNASADQLEAFLYIFNAACRNFATDDEDLNERANLYAALRFAIVEATFLDESIFDGTDTQVGLRALELIGVNIPNPGDFITMQKRMVDFEISLGRPLDYRNEIFDLLVSGFFGQDPSGSERPGLPAILNTYFANEGFNPELGGTRADLPQIDAGLALLPADFMAYGEAISTGAANTALRNIVMSQLDTVREGITAIVGIDENIDDGTLDDALRDAPGLEASGELSRNNPAYVQAVLDTLRAELEATAQARTAASSATYLMLQSDDSAIGAYASFTRDYSQIALETNEQLADTKAGIKFASTIAIGAIGAQLGNPELVIASFASMGGKILDMATEQNAAPSVDEQTFNQLIELREQVEQMRQEMNVRFDRIDQQFNAMTLVIRNGFNGIGDGIKDLQENVSSLVIGMAAARSELRRLEATLFGVAENDLLQELTFRTNLALNFRADNGQDFPYGEGDSNFTAASSVFDTYATVISQSSVFSGSRSNPTVTLSDAELLTGGSSFASYINDLAVLPKELGVPALAPSTLAGIEPWSQAASAYAQLARENPWYFGYRFGGGAKTELDRITKTGEQFVDFVDAIRDIDVNGNSALFEALIQNYKSTALQFQAELDNATTAILPDQFKNGSEKLNIWSGSPQLDLLNVTGPITIEPGIWATLSLPIPSNAPFQGWGTFTNYGAADEVARLQTMYLIERAKRAATGQNPNDIRVTSNHYLGSENHRFFRLTFENLRQSGSQSVPRYRVRRTVGYEAEFYTEFSFLQAYWSPVYDESASGTEDRFRKIWNDTLLKNIFTDSRATMQSGLFTSSAIRFRFVSRSHHSTYPILDDEILPDLHYYRAKIRTDLIDMLEDPSSALSLAANKLDQAVAILNAYVSIGMPKELGQSQLLRSALRAVPGKSELGLGSADVMTLIRDMDEADNNPLAWANQSFNVTKIKALLNERIDAVAEEIQLGLQNPATTPGYVGWVLAELNHLQSTALDLPVDDTYIITGSGGIVSMSAEEGLLMNDVDQPELTISIDLDFVSTPEHGTLTLNKDGSFTYQADPGFFGTDSFQYQSTALIPRPGTQPIFSNPATAVVIVVDADSDGDGFTDSNDNCPADPNLEQIDIDNDNLGDICDTDIDGDGIPNDWETDNGLDPEADDAAADKDDDDLSNLEEYTLLTDPNKPDTDNDDLSDFDEVTTYGTNPASADTDNDGLSDYDELNTHGTNPALADTDKDGVDDVYDLENGFDPLDSNNYPSWMIRSSKIWLYKFLQSK
jgi:hypothetical protein